MCRIANVCAVANARSPDTSSPGSISTASRVSSHPTTKPFLKNGPTAWLSTIMIGDDLSRSRRPDVHLENQDDRDPPRRGSHLRALRRCGTRRNADNAAVARDPRPEQSPYEPA